MSKPKVVACIKGGIGNQLFSYAAARSLALKNNADLVIDAVNGFKKDHDYKRTYQLDHFSIPCIRANYFERFEPFPRLRKKLNRIYNQFFGFGKSEYIEQIGVEYEPRFLEIKLNGSVYVEGYWQSEMYFKGAEAVIRNDLIIKAPKDLKNKSMAAQIKSVNAVAIHLRFFDLPSDGGVNNATKEYYINAIKMIEELESNVHYFLFSNEPDEILKVLDLQNINYTIVNHNLGDDLAYADLWLMSLCRHFIIANSTFSWWGAWLGSFPQKKVIAPGFKMFEGKMWWGFDGLIPSSWTQI